MIIRKIYTADFRNAGKVPLPVAISRIVPPNFRGSVYARLAPSPALEEGYYKGTLSAVQYAQQYLDLLARRGLSPDLVLQELPLVCTLLCWERPYQFCHRHVVGRWIESHTGVRVREYGRKYIQSGLGIE